MSGYSLKLKDRRIRNFVFNDLKKQWDKLSEFEQIEICQTFINAQIWFGEKTSEAKK